MAYTFFKARGLPVGTSLVEDDKLDAARQIEADAAARGVGLELPVDHVVADRVDAGAAHEVLAGRRSARSAIGWASTSARRRSRPTQALIGDAKTVVWNGPMGVFEIERVRGRHQRRRARGRGRRRARRSSAAATRSPRSRRPASPTRITHISTGGGASLEFLGGRTLPGVAALTDSDGLPDSGRARHADGPQTSGL